MSMSARDEVVLAHELERRRFARDLHDECGQHLTALRFHLDALMVRAVGSPFADDVDRLATLAAALDESLEAIAGRVRPPCLEAGLGPAVSRLAMRWSARTGIPLRTDGLRADPSGVPDEIAVHVYRIAQEALHNVAKHARARRVRLRLAVTRSVVALTISDDGVGFSPAIATARRLTGGYGLVSLRERASILGGALRIRSVAGRGTTVRLVVPVSMHGGHEGRDPDALAPAMSPSASRIRA